MKVHDARDGFNDLKPEFLPGINIPWFWIALIILAVLILLRFRPKSKVLVKRVRKNLSEYIAELSALETKLKSGADSAKSLTGTASLIVRGYLFDRIGVSILECTPQEAEALLKATQKFSVNEIQEISKLLLQLESITFASNKEESDPIQARAGQLIVSCKTVLEKHDGRFSEVVA